MVETEGPALELLVRRVAETPAEFLWPPRVGGVGRLHVAAVVQDLLAQAQQVATLSELDSLGPRAAGAERAHLGVVALLCWLLSAPELQVVARPAPLFVVIVAVASELAREGASAATLREDPERREELVRLCLARLGCRPAGESVVVAADRLVAISTAERNRVLAASRAAEERARRVREALARQAAQDAADKWSRE